ncbi:hypothetical protein ES703_98725 [subsurface metagenome]
MGKMNRFPVVLDFVILRNLSQLLPCLLKLSLFLLYCLLGLFDSIAVLVLFGLGYLTPRAGYRPLSRINLSLDAVVITLKAHQLFCNLIRFFISAYIIKGRPRNNQRCPRFVYQN